MVRLLPLLAALGMVAGCSLLPVRYVQPELPLPARPTVPTVAEEDLQCLPEGVYSDLAESRAVRVQHVKTLEAIIRSTHKE